MTWLATLYFLLNFQGSQHDMFTNSFNSYFKAYLSKKKEFTLEKGLIKKV
jgi:hypothetical protein